MLGRCHPQILAQRIEEALARGLPLDGLTGDKHVIPEHMRFATRHMAAPEVYCPAASVSALLANPVLCCSRRNVVPSFRNGVQGTIASL